MPLQAEDIEVLLVPDNAEVLFDSLNLEMVRLLELSHLPRNRLQSAVLVELVLVSWVSAPSVVVEVETRAPSFPSSSAELMADQSDGPLP